MYTYKAKISMRDTDATGVIYFTEQMRLCVEAFENFLEEKQFPLAHMLEKSSYGLPIVHAESDYFAPLKVGDPVEIFLSIAQVGTSSITFNYLIKSLGSEKGKVTLIHVAVDKTTRTTIPLPEEFLCVIKKFLNYN